MEVTREHLVGLELALELANDRAAWGMTNNLRDLIRLAEAAPVTDLGARMKAAGMHSIDEMLAGTPMDTFVRNNSVVNLDTFGQWLEMKRREYITMQATLALDKHEDDEMFGWVLAHNSVFSEAHVNFKAAISNPAQSVPDGFKMVPEDPEHGLMLHKAWLSMGNDGRRPSTKIMCLIYRAMLAAAPITAIKVGADELDKLRG